MARFFSSMARCILLSGPGRRRAGAARTTTHPVVLVPGFLGFGPDQFTEHRLSATGAGSTTSSATCRPAARTG